MVSYHDLRDPAMTAVSIYSVEGLSGLGGRLLLACLLTGWVRTGSDWRPVGASFGDRILSRRQQARPFYALSIVFGTPMAA